MPLVKSKTEGFNSNSFTNSVKQISTIKTTKTETSKMNLKGSNSGEEHWVTLKNGNHVLIED